MAWLGIDVGGTFTDLVLYDPDAGRLSIAKIPSTPDDQARGVLAGIARLGIAPATLTRIAHGSTVATNTALERNGASMAAVVTEGHRDVIGIGRGNRTRLYDIKATRPAPLVPRDRCLALRERMLADGSVLIPLDAVQIDKIAAMLSALALDAVAVCFLHSYANPQHERHVAEILRAALPGVFVCASSDVLPEYREHERFSTTVLNAYVAPRMRRYLGSLTAQLEHAGCRAGLTIMTSNGGTLPAARIETLPALSMLSGPAAGVVAAGFIGAEAGFPDVITYDMGGTSTDVCVIRAGGYAMTASGHVGSFPIAIRQIDINTVGAGGGSIASLDAGSVLRVGPRSAGAFPGPCCYGRGGTEATVTDANVVLGRLGSEQLLGGEIRLDPGLARAAIARLADRIGLGIEATAEGVLRIAVVNMTAAIKEVSVMRGLDPRDFTLMAYGGAGPLHGADVAEELGIRTVMVPPMPGNFSAFGLLVADVRRDFVRTRITRTEATALDTLHVILAELAAQAAAELREAGFPPDRQHLEASLDMRYAGQAFELSVAITLQPDDIAEVDDAFRRVYAARYGEAVAGATEIVNYRLAAWGRTTKPRSPEPVPRDPRSMEDRPTETRHVVFGGVARATALLARDALDDAPYPGPVIVTESGSSTVVPPGWQVRAGPSGLLILERA